MPTLFHKHFSLRTLIQTCFIAAIGMLFLCYVAFQARHIVIGPRITLLNESSSITATSTHTIYGVAENIISLSLNGRTIYTDDGGKFQETLLLPLGYTVVTLTAQDRYGRVRALTRTYVRTQKEVAINH